MLPKFKLEIKGSKEYSHLIEYLLKNYPLENTHSLLLYLKNKDGYYAAASWCKMAFGVCNRQQLCKELGSGFNFDIKIALGLLSAPHSKAKVMHTIVHEYRHALQKTNNLQVQDEEADAESFADEVLSKYLKESL